MSARSGKRISIPDRFERLGNSSVTGVIGFRVTPSCRIADPDLLLKGILSARCCHMNAIARAMYRAPDGDLAETTFFDFIRDHPENRDLIEQFIREGFTLTGVILRERAFDGTERYFMTNLQGSVRADRLTSIWGMKTDITEWKSAEISLREREERYRLTLDSLSDMVHVIDRSFRIILANTATRSAILEYSPGIDTIDGSNLFHCFPFLENRIRDEYLRVMLTHQPLRTVELTRVNDHEIWTETHKFPVMDDARRLFGVITIIRDITSIKRSEEALLHAERRYRDLVENLEDALYQVNRDGVIEFISPAIHAITGHTPDEVRGCHFIDFIVESEREEVGSFFLSLKERIKVSRRFHVLRKDGSICPIRASLRAIIENDEYLGVRGVIEDMTDQVKVEQEKERLHQQLVRSQKLEEIGILAGGIAHDFNNLLTVIQGHNQLAMMDLSEHHPAHAELRHIHQTLTRASNLTRQLLIFSRKESVQFRPLNLNATIQNMLKMIRRMIPENIEIRTELNDQPWLLFGDEGTIEQVVLNICVNARDAMPDGGTLIISTDAVVLTDADCTRYPMASPGNFTRITFTDSGVGISAGNLERIFDPFFTTKEKGKGTGLGLSIVYGIVKQHGGWLRVNSDPGRGARFEVFFPAGQAVSAPPPVDESPYTVLRGASERILLIEDDASVRQLLQRILDKHNYTVYTAETIERAREILEQEQGRFDLLFTDVVLPDGNGIVFAREMRKRYPELPVLCGSGYPAKVAQIPESERSQFRILLKPYRLTELLQEIHQRIKRAGR